MLKLHWTEPDFVIVLFQVSPPDSNGFCTLGTGADSTRAAVTLADLVIGFFYT